MIRKLSMDELNRVSPDENKQTPKLPIFVALDNIRSMSNIGSVFRTADAMGVGALYLCGITATPPHREIQKTALGATESVEWMYYSTTLEAITAFKQLYTNGQVMAVEQTTHSTLLHTFQFNSQVPLLLVFGNEVEGVSDEVLPHCNGSIEIPQVGSKHSLNVSVSAGIVLWEMIRTKV